MNSMLNLASTWTQYLTDLKSHNPQSLPTDWIQPLMEVLSTVLWIVLAVVGAAGAIYAVYVGIKMARADSAEAREENKKRLINIIVAIVVTIALIVFFNIFLPMILSAFIDYDYNPGSGSGGSAIAEAAKLFLHM